MTKEGKEKKAKKEKKEKRQPVSPVENGKGENATQDVTTPSSRALRSKGMLIPIASPLADDKLSKRVLKVAKKAAKEKLIRRGVKEVVKALRKGSKGYCIIAGDISPLDVITHLPVFCEEKKVPYIYVRSKEELGAAGLTKRPTSCMLVLPPKPNDGDITDYQTSFDDILAKVKDVQVVF
eukprot:jgi/Botrbrau1/632/Bobra.0161s0023.1